jgi:hypothetical protein
MSVSWDEEMSIVSIEKESPESQDIEGSSSRLPEMHLLWN